MMAARSRQAPTGSSKFEFSNSIDTQPYASLASASPLETLVRRTSSKRNPNPNSNTNRIMQDHSNPNRAQMNMMSLGVKIPSHPRNGAGGSISNDALNSQPTVFPAPHSPLIHSRFRRGSNATASSRGGDSSFASGYPSGIGYVDNSFMDLDLGDNADYDPYAYEDPREVFTKDGRDSFDSRNSDLYNIYAGLPEQRYSEASRYGEEVVNGMEAPSRNPWQTHSEPMGKPSINAMSRPIDSHNSNNYLFASSSSGPPSPSSPSSGQVLPPEVIVTSPVPGPATPQLAGRTPIVRNVGAVSNYSRPVRSVYDSGTNHNHDDSRNNRYNDQNTSAERTWGEYPSTRTTTARTHTPTPPRPNSSAAPILEAEVLSSEAKQRVLERNLDKRRRDLGANRDGRGGSPSPNSTTTFTSSTSSSYATSSSRPTNNTHPQTGTTETGTASPGYGYPNDNSFNSKPSSSRGPSPLSPSPTPSYDHEMARQVRGPRSQNPSRSRSPIPTPNSTNHSTNANIAAPNVPANRPPNINTAASSYSSTYNQNPNGHLDVVTQLHRRPPSFRLDSPASLYSDAYSFYQLDDGSPAPSSHGSSPNGSTFTFKGDGQKGYGGGSPLAQSHHAPASVDSQSPNPGGGKKEEPVEVSKAEQFLHLGIKHHEANRLDEAALCFEKSAKLELEAETNSGVGAGRGVGGTASVGGMGMLMWGLTLRHGWGVKKDEKGGFGWVRRAAEGAVRDLERLRLDQDGEGKDTLGDEKGKSVVKAELVLAIYEVGQCFFHGWGVKKDEKMGVSYYRVAARLGDADAQNDLGFALANGKGCKKDRKEAAKWLRAAVAQGHSEVGLAWIHKEKFL